MCERLRVSEGTKPARNKNRKLKPHAKMKTPTKLTLTTVAAMTLGASSLLAGPGPGNWRSDWPKAPARELPAVTPLKCKSMFVNRNPKLGGPTAVTCTKAIKDTLACRLACR